MYNRDIVFLDLPMQPTAIIGSAEVAFDLMDKRSNIYSNRPIFVLAKMIGWHFNTAAMPYSDLRRAHRRIFHQGFHKGAVNKYQPFQRQQTRVVLS
ncbi:hypothetical protein BXZ70DRAFT_740757 [Cristinia sonorae]|uniref:Uncharacterized protein n=1 Tax=Cristinia sonorae TaxID=1940300 RepID=A0A8K0UTB2_9AGAR|nr:hypothetical protein BXZ70DRAFT_740757 [Cristinia sonorae]